MSRRRRTDPPLLAQRLLRWVVPADARDGVLGDLEEDYARRREGRGPSRLWYWGQVLSLTGHYVVRRLSRRVGAAFGGGERGGEGMTTHDLTTDIRMALRSFRKAPGFMAASVLVLAIGLGAVTFMFSTLDAVALRPLPFQDPDELVWVWGSSEQYRRNSISYENYADHRAQVDAFEELAAFYVFQTPVVLTGSGEPERVMGSNATANLFDLLGVEPALGRGLVEADGEAGAAPVAVLSHSLWQRRHGGDPSVLGSALTVDGVPHDVVGVMPAGFDYPGAVEVWRPVRRDEGYAQGRGNNNFSVVGRLRDGVDIAQAQAQADVVSRQLQAAYPDVNRGLDVVIVSLHERYFGGVRPALILLLGIVTVVLLIACANVASLALARASTRRGEVAVRLSLGAARARVIRQLLTEHLVIAVAGGVAGLALAKLGIGLLKSVGPAGLPRLDEVALDARAVGFAFVAALLTGIVFGTVPAFRGSAVSLSESLKAGAGRGGGGRTGGRAVLVVAQVALSLMLLMASGLLVRSFTRLQNTDLGFQTGGLLMAQLELPVERYGDPEVALRAWDGIEASLAAIPGVRAVGATDRLPIRSGGGPTNGVYAEGRQPEQYSDYLPARRRFVSEGLLVAQGVQVMAGRLFTRDDTPESQPVTVINESLARALWPEGDGLGRVMVLPWGEGIPLEVIGVVGDTRDSGPGVDPLPVFYLSFRQFPGAVGSMGMVMRTEGDVLTLAGSLRNVVWAVDADVPVSSIETAEDRLAVLVSQPRFRAGLVGLFAGTSLLLAVLGLYAVLAYFVRQSTHEIAVRVAVGAGRGDVVGLVVRRGLSLALGGVALGLLGGLATGRLLQGFLFGVEATDLLTMATATATMLVVAVGASLVPARRAVRVAPVEALNTE